MTDRHVYYKLLEIYFYKINYFLKQAIGKTMKLVNSNWSRTLLRGIMVYLSLEGANQVP
jgi:hypothetical protein